MKINDLIEKGAEYGVEVTVSVYHIDRDGGIDRFEVEGKKNGVKWAIHVDGLSDFIEQVDAIIEKMIGAEWVKYEVPDGTGKTVYTNFVPDFRKEHITVGKHYPVNFDGVFNYILGDKGKALIIKLGDECSQLGGNRWTVV